MPKAAVDNSQLSTRVVARLGRRVGPLVVSVVYVALGLAYVFRWAPVVRHVPSAWISPGDLSATYRATSALAHGHFGSIYSNSSVLTFPGILILLAPLGALSNHFDTTFVEIMKNHHPVTQPAFFVSHTTQILVAGPRISTAHIEYAIQPQWFAFLEPYVLVLSCTALFAFDALAERLQVPSLRRTMLNVTQAVLLWPVIVIFGHPEDAVAIALAEDALVFAFDDRFTWAGWLFGAAFAVQPLVVVLFPLFLVMGGRRRAPALVAQGVLPALVVTVGPVATNFHQTLHNVVNQPAYSDISGTHQTPWTFLAPRLGGRGSNETVGGGPVRLATLVLAAGLGWWARRWKDKPEMLAWAAALALALRTYTESVMTAYYVWPALAVGMVVAARGSRRRFGISIAVAVLTTIVAEWHLGVYPWWLLVAAGVTAVLMAAARPEAPVPAPVKAPRERARASAPTQRRPGAAASKKKRKPSGRSRSGAGRR